ncbi:hypothetical protein NQ317_009930 [Molorchus minor]|uniref:Rab-GAP TBC domain-containing protein n=1 Tax=Molorchus minor TaxID=1323400 RepID=A0ABQ9K7D7_9CUCU|nr:hypothetical protein NQ317_009930 [Molorchus minor]
MDGESDRSSFWKKNLKTVPGRPSPKREAKNSSKSKTPGSTSFQDFQASVSDAWEMDDDEFCIISATENTRISKRVSQSAALNVLNTHRNTAEIDVSSSERNNKPHIAPEPNTVKISRIPGRPRQLHYYNPPQEEDNESKLERFEALLENPPSLQELSKMSWSGIPVKVRGITWRLLSGYLPINIERRNGVLERKRHDYWTLVEKYYYTEHDETNRDIQHQINIDVPRMNPSIALFQQKTVQIMFEHSIQDNYVFAQVGIQKKVLQLEELIKRVDEVLHKHLKRHNVSYLQFSFRWLNNLLTRELPLRCTIRLWDTYLAESDCFATFQLYVCAAFLLYWKEDLMQERDFQGLLLLLQNLPTQSWTSSQISMLVAEAYKLKVMFADAPNHLLSNSGDS